MRERAVRLTSEQYQFLGEAGLIPEKVELLDGVIVEKMSKSPIHSGTAQKLVWLLNQVVPDGWLVHQEQPITRRYSEPEPDVAVVRGTRNEYFRAHPTTAELVIEVAVSSSEIDLGKAAIYAEANVPEYWIVLPEEQKIEIFTAPDGQVYTERRTVVPPQTAFSNMLPAFQLDWSTFFSS